MNVAARLESSGEAGRVNVSAAIRAGAGSDFRFTPRGKIAAKNVGDIDMFFVDGQG